MQNNNASVSDIRASRFYGASQHKIENSAGSDNSIPSASVIGESSPGYNEYTDLSSPLNNY